MKKFEDIKIVAVLCCHDNDSFLQKCLDGLSKYAKNIYVNLNEPTEETERIVMSHPSVVNVVRTTNNGGRWNQGMVRDAAIRMLDNVCPDIVLFPDDDELFCDNTREQLKEFWENEDYKTMWWRLLYLWDDEKHFRNDRYWRSIHHVRCYKWQPGVTYVPYSGYACPTTFIKEPKKTRFNANKPIIHYGYLREDDRSRKFLRSNSDYCNSTFREKLDKNMIILPLPEDLIT